MTPPTSEFTDLLHAIIEFRDEREWQQFHKPHHLATALSIEVAELQELFLWKSEVEVTEALQEGNFREKLSDELADLLIYTLLFAHEADIDLPAAVRSKLGKNRLKYPVELAKGSARKYTELEADSHGEKE